MKKKLAITVAIFLLFSCNASSAGAKDISSEGAHMKASNITQDTRIRDIISDGGTGGWARLLFPADWGYWSGDTLGTFSLTWYSHISAKKTVEIVRLIKESLSHIDNHLCISYDATYRYLSI